MQYTLDFSSLLQYSDALWTGLRITLIYTALSLIIGIIVGFLASLGRTSTNLLVRGVTTIYVEIFRDTPVLLQLFWFFFCLPIILGLDIGNAISVVISLSLYMGALCCETFRSAQRSIGSEQFDACIALGLSARVKILYVILPQTILRSVPNLLSNAVTIFKESSLVSTVGMTDLIFQSQFIADSTSRPIEVLTVAAGIYFVIAFTTTRIATYLEKRLISSL
ncbi:amino acid ABC transporter permease [Rouxiella badensis]|uniref:Amino acid ABC transporter permease n=1 Tax=Rahnella perminowiae TaxID=2816244 RepID=A0ABS6L0Z5_9GAMM|nr:MULTISPECIES: amino acid ABC transporter permease [Enterobacterales]MBU9808334.1 amino acid ABC transporter permease [Rahnella perminowiae]MBU9814988.1 amino acid ABC transporter permease [Rahnella perminowiae]MBU9827944.1 amino acid ABC transporter permease [Rahnella perminowiae]MBU9835512.1 amino acid ABC transporter permease [Rahnella perminowiae]MBU9860143.1 amino acid ABC transporter permease [Rahnella aceris]